ncbi:hypothetical protein OPQ81_011172 [Rhizoctonia solani]|nr:hypothetical protein OPQ81_011172 [Rhizoctonia solani]
MKDLPTELVYMMVSDHLAAAALTLVNRYYNHIVTPILYGEITLEGCIALKAFGGTLATGRPILRQYPRSLYLFHYPENAHNDTECLKQTIRQILMHVPNLVDLHLTLNPLVVRYLLKEPKYPFMLGKLRMVPTKDSLFIEFLKTQPHIEHLHLMSGSGDDDLYFKPGWHGVSTTLEPQILPNLKSIKSDKASVSFLTPHHPVTSISLFQSHKDLDFHKDLAKSSAPLERLSECIQLWEVPWETGIVSRCLPSLEFCQQSLREYSLDIVGTDYRLIQCSVLLFLKNRDDPSYGLSSVKKGLSAFPELEKFRLNFHIDWYNDLTPQFCETVPELSEFGVWKESCPKLQEVTLFGVTLKP